jgi:hypothetical protein
VGGVARAVSGKAVGDGDSEDRGGCTNPMLYYKEYSAVAKFKRRITFDLLTLRFGALGLFFQK